MAESKNNIITHGLSGKVGDLLVFSQRNGKTFVSKAPKKPTVTSESRQAVQARFQKAVFYAKGSLANPATKAEYEAKASPGQTAYNVAIADFFQAPNIEKVDFSKYTGKVGDMISIQVTDDFKVKQVSLSIANSDGTLVEEGPAVATGDGLHWIYTATKKNDSLSGDKITVKAGDLTENLSVKEELL